MTRTSRRPAPPTCRDLPRYQSVPLAWRRNCDSSQAETTRCREIQAGGSGRFLTARTEALGTFIGPYARIIVKFAVGKEPAVAFRNLRLQFTVLCLQVKYACLCFEQFRLQRTSAKLKRRYLRMFPELHDDQRRK